MGEGGRGLVAAAGRKSKEETQELVLLRSQNHGSLSGISRVLATCLGSWAGQRLKKEKGEGDKQEQYRVPALESLTY